MKTVLILGGGGREHCLAWKLAQSPRVKQVWVAPGNPGLRGLNKVGQVHLSPSSAAEVLRFAKAQRVDLIVVGPEGPLAAGVTDPLVAAGLRCFGPSQAASQLESSKRFAKRLMDRLKIRTARWAYTEARDEAERLLRAQTLPCVIKADGLAAGKGSFVIHSLKEGLKTLDTLMVHKALGPAGERVIIEDFLVGQELSLHAICDGQTALPLIAARDYKARFNDDRGPNTGGMGCYAPFGPSDLPQRATRLILQPIVSAMAARGTPFVGALYAGLMLNNDGLNVLEFNVRFGDPETQVLLPLLQDDLFSRLYAAASGRQSAEPLSWSAAHAVNVVAVQQSYPKWRGDPSPLHGASDHDLCFFSGVSESNDQLYASGGRVFSATGLGRSRAEAARAAYEHLKQLRFNGLSCRTDVGRLP